MRWLRRRSGDDECAVARPQGLIAGLVTYLCASFALSALAAQQHLLACLLGACGLFTLGRLVAAVWRVDADGLVVVDWPRRPRRYGWADIQHASVAQGWLSVTLRDGLQLRLGSTAPGWAKLSALLLEGFDRQRHGDQIAPPLDDLRLARLLGLPLDVVIGYCPDRFRLRAGHPGTMCAAVVLALAGTILACVTCRWQWFIPAFAPTAVITMLLPTWPGFTATAQGVTIDSGFGREHIPWRRLRFLSADPLRGRTTVHHTLGSFTIRHSAPVAAELIQLCERAIELRRQGHELPDGEPIPEGALSRMTGDESTADRGLSVTHSEESDGPA